MRRLQKKALDQRAQRPNSNRFCQHVGSTLQISVFFGLAMILGGDASDNRRARRNPPKLFERPGGLNGVALDIHDGKLNHAGTEQRLRLAEIDSVNNFEHRGTEASRNRFWKRWARRKH